MPEPLTQTAHPDTATVPPPGDAAPPAPGRPTGDRYQLGDEIARGGMGAVYRARDTALHRAVAVKVLHPKHAPDSAAARRFADEARITARLQHPAIPPVHDLGTLPDGRPFLAMKLVRGDTLDALLKARAHPEQDRGRFVAIFEQIAQAVAFAHSHGIVHRDLKPLNVMVGRFGEVQVMDWGIAKVLADAGDPDLTADADEPAPGRADDGATLPGSVLGTPAFMPPEQAVGAVSRIDRRSDVFGLGAVLCVVLTGRPPYTGGTTEAVRVAAARGQLDACFGRLDASGADPELVALCKRCLSADPDARPADAGAVAQAVADLRHAADDRARRAELDRARAELQAAERRKRRRVQLALTAAVVLLLAAGGAFPLWQNRHEAERALADERAEGERRRLDGERELAQARAEAADRRRVEVALASAAELLDQFRFAEAQTVLDRAAGQLPFSAPGELGDRLRAARADLALVRELDDIRFARIRAAPGGDGAVRMTAAYRAAFAKHRMNPAAGPGAALDWVNRSRVKRFLLVSLDTWARYEADPEAQARLAELARAADPSVAATVLRDPAAWGKADDRARLGARVNLDDLPAHLLVLYFQVRDEDWPAAPAEFARAAARFPNDFWVQFEAAYYFTFKRKGDDAVRRKSTEESIGYWRAVLAVRPDHPYAWYLLGRALDMVGRPAEAVDALDRALALDPAFADARVLRDLLARRGPGHPPAGDGGLAAFDRGRQAEQEMRFADAAREFELALAQGYPNRGAALYLLGKCRRKLDQPEAAERALLDAVAAGESSSWVYYDLGSLYVMMGRWAEAEKALRTSIAKFGRFAYAHNDLGLALAGQGRWAEALAACRRAAQVAPDDANILMGLKRMEELCAAHTAPPPRRR